MDARGVSLQSLLAFLLPIIGGLVVVIIWVFGTFSHHIYRAASLSVSTLGTSWVGISLSIITALWLLRSVMKTEGWRAALVQMAYGFIPLGTFLFAFFVKYLIWMPAEPFQPEEIAQFAQHAVVQIGDDKSGKGGETLGAGLWLDPTGVAATCSKTPQSPVSVSTMLPFTEVHQRIGFIQSAGGVASTKGVVIYHQPDTGIEIVRFSSMVSTHSIPLAHRSAEPIIAKLSVSTSIPVGTALYVPAIQDDPTFQVRWLSSCPPRLRGST